MVDQTQEATLFLAIFTIWMSFLYIRVFDKKVKKYIFSIGVLLVFWMTTKIVKIKTTGTLESIMWYLYYIPMIFIPTLYYGCSEYLAKTKGNKRIIFSVIMSALLSLLVVTNNFHNLVFKISEEGIDKYTYKFGYYVIYAWIILLLVVAIKNLFKSNKEKRHRNIMVISMIIFAGIIYTICYNNDLLPYKIRNMPVVVGVLYGIGLELFFDFDLIPNNFRYRKFFVKSNLPLAIVSEDGEKVIKTNYLLQSENSIINDIKLQIVSNTYETKNAISRVKKTYGGYALEEKDLTKVNELKRKIQKVNKELVQQENTLKKQKEIKTQMYELELKGDVINAVDTAIAKKREKISTILSETKDITEEKIHLIKLLISYCKRMSCLVISNYNDETYDSERLKLILSELFIDANFFNINGTIQTNTFVINSNEAIDLYEIIFEVLLNLGNICFILNIQIDEQYMELKYVFDKKEVSIRSKIQGMNLQKVAELKEENTEDGTILKIKIVRGKE